MHDYNYRLSTPEHRGYWIDKHQWYFSRALWIPLLLLVIVLSVAVMNHYHVWHLYVIFGWVIVKTLILLLDVVRP